MSTENAGKPDLPLERFSYDDAIVRKFVFATLIWGFVGMLVGVLIALQLAWPKANDFGLDAAWTQILAFGRLRPLHTNAVIFAFAGNAIFAAVYYSSQRLLKARMFSDLLSRLHFWGWQLIIVLAAVTLPLGITTGKEYAELEWPIDILIALVWIVFGINFFGTLVKRREKHIYVAIWFYIATWVAITVLHVFNSLEVPATLTRSYSLYAGAQDAFMQWWYGHNAVAFFLTTPFLGLMYYFLPKAANRPVFSYRLSIIHFWSLVFIYIWAGPHHLHYLAVPEWLSTLGMLFSLMLWMPSWGGMLNGLLTLRGAWDKVAKDPILKFFVVGVTFYGMSTFEGPMLSVKAVNALSHYTDWTIAHVHGGALGWVGFMCFGMAYWLLPRLFQTGEMAKPKWLDLHFYLATLGILVYIVSIYAAGLTQGLMWRAFDDTGLLKYTDFMDTVRILRWFYVIRLAGGLLYLTGAGLALVNAVLTWKKRPAAYEVPVYEAPPLSALEAAAPAPVAEKALRPFFWAGLALAGVCAAVALIPGVTDSPKVGAFLALVGGFGLATAAIDLFMKVGWHRRLEGRPLAFTGWVAASVVSASLFEAIPTFVIESNVPTISAVKPYTPLELAGRDIYLAEGCYNCHSQLVRPIRAETERYGPYSKAGEFVYDHPFQWGSRRIGPDLARVGTKTLTPGWHLRHLRNPLDTSPDSLMPRYKHLLEAPLDFAGIPKRMRAMQILGVPYDDTAVAGGAEAARAQAEELAARLEQETGVAGLADKKVTALIAYLLRLGTDAMPKEAGR
ncbi:MAG: cytochrome-c oxidase, cbb3-type subunit I [Planctomycetota bacterium]|nr:MAG: cytochrome-c oxidase, cbb3-type subunit I [Planctomycetota bacterium]